MSHNLLMIQSLSTRSEVQLGERFCVRQISSTARVNQGYHL